MNYENKADSVPCKENFALRLLPYGLWVLSAIWFNSGSQSATPLFWLFWCYLGIMLSIYNPDFVIYDDGIEIKLWWMHPFVRWEDIHGAYQDTFRTRIRIRKVTPPNRIIQMIVNSGFFIMAWRENYGDILYMLKKQLGNRFYAR